MREPALASIAAQRRALARRDLSALELADAHLARIARLQPALNAFIRVDPRAVRAAARAADRALARGEEGPLLGIPIALKDIVDERGLPNTAGSALRRRAVARADAPVVARLRAAGAILIGRTNLHEFAAGTTNANVTFGQVHNPHDPGRIPGGSSGGSATAVATGLAAGALGTDTAGSIRIPAALCGVVGLKPTYDLVSRRGVVPLSWSLDHVGPIARTVDDARVLLGAMTGMRVAGGSGVRGLRFSLGDAYFAEAIDPRVRAALRRGREALIAAGLREVRTRLPLVRSTGAIQLLVARPESTAAHVEDLVAGRAERIGGDVRARLEVGFKVTAVEYLQAQRARTVFAGEVDHALEAADVILTPTTASGALLIGAHDAVVAGRRQSQRELLVRFTAPFNLSGHPALALPAGWDANGLPVSLQIVGRAYDEVTVLRVARTLERAFDLDLTPSIAR